MEGLQEKSNIFDAAIDCDELFDKCLRQIAEPGTGSLLGGFAVAIGRLARDHQARFLSWTSYLGVFAKQSVSLDRRLSSSKDVQVMIMDLLRIIDINLRHFLSMIQISKDDDAINIATDLGQAQEAIEGAIDRLHRLGVTIRQSSTASLITRVKAFSTKRSDPFLEEIPFLMIKYLYPTAPLGLQQLLGRSILERYFNLKYREEHQRRLATRRSTVVINEKDQSQVYYEGLELPGLTIGKGFVDEFAGRVVDSDTMLSKSGTKPSTLQPDEFKRNTEAENRRAALSAISRTSSVPIGDISYPKPPKPSGNGELSRAICSWCSESFPYGNFQDVRWWRRHVDHDFRPYVCLFDTCSASLNAFDRFSPWLKHMEEHHSTNWIATIDYKTFWRCDIEHKSPELFGDEASLRDHMREHHLQLFTESQLVGIARRSSIRIPGSNNVCPLCRFDASKVSPVAVQTYNSQHSSRNKRKRGSKHDLRANVHVSAETKRRKVHFHNQAESSSHESFSSSGSDLDLTDGPGTEPISPQVKARLQRKQLSRHIATHLKALSFMSLRLGNFQEPFEEGDKCSTTGDEPENTNEGGEPSGLDTELEALSLSFSDDPGSPESLIYDFSEYLDSLGPTEPTTLSQSSTAAHQELEFIGGDTSNDNLHQFNRVIYEVMLWGPVTREDILDHQRSVESRPGPSSSTFAMLGDRLIDNDIPNVPSSPNSLPASPVFGQELENELLGGMSGPFEATHPEFSRLEIPYRNEQSPREAGPNLEVP